MKFVDQVKIAVDAGDGGDGCMSFLREKYVPRGGPDGGAGGDGGSVVLVGSRKLATLADLQYHNRYQDDRGRHGKGKNKTGRSGDDTLVPVPLGTDAYDAVSGELIAEITEEGMKVVAARGGQGGRGNLSFKTHDNVAPRRFETGKPGERRMLRLELRIMSDIGLVGFPNAGKSTLLSRLTRAMPRIADYPFTTLTPNLGALIPIGGDSDRSANSAFNSWDPLLVVADLPGIVEGAAEGKGLGLRFLRHIERTRALVFVIDVGQPNPYAQYRTLQAEIRAYNPAILDKPRALVYNKIDLLKKRPVKPKAKVLFLAVSALTGEGIDQLAQILKEISAPKADPAPNAPPQPETGN